MIEFIFMLTHNDATVPNALEVLDEVQDAGLRYIGFKDVGQPPEVLTEIAARAHGAGLEVMLEVVSTSVQDELRSVRAALEIGVDWVLGGTHPDEAGAILAGTDVCYCPFPGTIVGHPSVLQGAPDAIAAHAAELTARPGVHGLDLLAYRHPDTDPVALTRQVVEAASGPVIVAGSIVGADQIAAVADAGAWGFTIGGAIFEQRLPGAPTVREQVRGVLDLDVVAEGTRAPR
jgi:DhnA family fructose-bisphosphate aldolase class Ia